MIHSAGPADHGRLGARRPAAPQCNRCFGVGCCSGDDGASSSTSDAASRSTIVHGGGAAAGLRGWHKAF